MSTIVGIQFHLSADEIKQKTQEIIDNYHLRLQSLLQIPPSQHTFKSSFATLSEIDGQSSLESTQCTFPSLVSSDPSVRESAVWAKKQLSSMWMETYSNADLYKLLGQVKCTLDHPEDIRYANTVLGVLKHNGAHLPEESRQKLSKIRQTIADISTEFESNLNEDISTVPFSQEELEGLPDSFLGALPKNQEGQLLVSLKAPHTLPVMQQAKAPETRKKLQFAMETKCLSTNGKLLEDLIRQRHEAAVIAGYKSHAHYMMEVKMAKTPENVKDFLENIAEKLKDRMSQDHSQLLELKRKEGLGDELNLWDIPYYSEVLRKTQYNINQEEVKEYFPLDLVIEEVINVYQEILGLLIKPLKDDIWNDEVRLYEVRSLDGSSLFGHFYLDMFSRPGKFAHQCVVPVKPSFTRLDGSIVNPACAMLCNISSPTANAPSLLRFREVETFFHEFGHVMHCLCTTSNHSRFSWAWPMVPWPGGVEQDFLEVPSMTLQQWVYDKFVLDKLSGHYQDHSRKLPMDIIRRLEDSRYMCIGHSTRRLCFMSLYDLLIHSQPAPYSFNGHVGLNAVELWSVMQKHFIGLKSQQGTHYSASWYHLAIGYDAGYYGYLWSEVYAYDICHQFKKSQNGLLDTNVGMKFQKTILQPGATQDGLDMCREFLGREPSSEAFLNELGIK